MKALIPRSELGFRKMRLGNESKYPIVIDGDALIEWTGYGWVLVRPVQPEDRRRFPAAVPLPDQPPLRSDKS